MLHSLAVPQAHNPDTLNGGQGGNGLPSCHEVMTAQVLKPRVLVQEFIQVGHAAHITAGMCTA